VLDPYRCDFMAKSCRRCAERVLYMSLSKPIGKVLRSTAYVRVASLMRYVQCLVYRVREDRRQDTAKSCWSQITGGRVSIHLTRLPDDTSSPQTSLNLSQWPNPALGRLSPDGPGCLIRHGSRGSFHRGRHLKPGCMDTL
jgi:hypothetical protein